MKQLHLQILGARRAWYAWLAASLLAIALAVIMVLGFAEGRGGPTGPGATPPPPPPPHLPTAPPPTLGEGIVAQGPLGDPTNLTGTAGWGTGEVFLTWSAAVYSTAQWVYVVKEGETDGWYWPESASGNPRGQYPTGDLAFTVSELGQDYWFAVVAVQEQADGSPMLVSNWSNWISLTVPAASPPTKPAPGSVDPNGGLDYPYGLTASAGTAPGEVVLRWTPSSQFNIYWVYLSEADGSRGRYWLSIFTNFDHLNREMFTIFDRDFHGH